MKLITGIKHKGKPFEIPNCSRNDLPEFFKEIGYKVGVEIGVYKGEFAKLFAKEGLKIYGIDPWKPYAGFDIDSENRTRRQNFLYGHTKRLLSPYKNVVLIRKTSMEALKYFKNETLDFVYIDGNHYLKYVVEDICEWSKKVKKGGIVSGHDYIHPRRVKDKKWGNRIRNLHAKFAVDAYIEAYGIKNWYLLGRQDAPWGETRDRFLSWFFIK